MSKDSVIAFIDATRADDEARRVLAEADVDGVLRAAKARGFAFTEADLAGVLKAKLYAAESLPPGWGWPLARRMGLVRS